MSPETDFDMKPEEEAQNQASHSAAKRTGKTRADRKQGGRRTYFKIDTLISNKCVDKQACPHTQTAEQIFQNVLFLKEILCEADGKCRKKCIMQHLGGFIFTHSIIGQTKAHIYFAQT